MKPFDNPKVAAIFAAYPPKIRPKLMALREAIFSTAAATDGVGEIEETLRWGEPAYVTSQTGSGSPIRIDWKKKKPSQYAMYFICTTTLVDTFRTLFPNDFEYEGNRAIVFQENDAVPMDSLAFCISMALTYRRSKANGKKLLG